MSIETGANWDISIGTTTPATDIAAFDLDTYNVIGKVSEIGEFGDSREIITFLELTSARVLKARGPADAGDAPLTFARDEADAGQIALEAAFNVSTAADEFNFRVRAADSGGTNPTTWYFRAKVSDFRQQSTVANTVKTLLATLAINSPVLKKAAA